MLTAIVKLQLGMGGDDRRQETDGRVVRLPVGHICGCSAMRSCN